MAAELTVGASERALVCRVGRRLCALPLSQVVETLRALPIELISNAPAFVLGVSIVRGEPLPVVCAARLVGDGASVRAARFVVLKARQRRVALAVDTVEGVRELAPDTLAALPPLLHDAGADVIVAIGTLDGDLLLALRSARMVPDSVWDGMSAGSAAS
jgi:purine-binding chemotaxis protein CheW